MTIRLADERDLPAIVAIYNASVPGRRATADLEPVSVNSRREWFREHTPQHRPIWVDEREGEVAGWLSFGRFYRRAAWDATVEVSVYVATDWQQRGVAHGLLAHALAEAPGLGVRSLMALIFGHNDPSLALFRNAGFDDWGRLPAVTELDGVTRDVVIVGRHVG